MILLIGATGRVGGAALKEILAQGQQKVRVLVRAKNRDKISALPNCEVVVGDVLEPATLPAAVEGVSAIADCLGTPRGPKTTAADYRRFGITGNANLITAAQATGRAPHFVYVSSYNADRARYFIDFETKMQTEAALKKSGMPYTILRPTAYMESLATDFIQNGSANLAGPFDRPVNLISVRDVGAAVARCLGNPSYYNQTLDLFGPERTTFLEAMKLYIDVSGRKVAIRQMPLSAFRMLSTLMSPWQPVMPVIYQLVRSLNELDWSGNPQPLQRLLDRSPLGFGELAKEI